MLTHYRAVPVVALLLSLAAPAAALGQQQSNPVADPRSVIVEGAARFTVLTPQLIRMEWAPGKQFEDHASLLFDLLAVAYQADLTRVFTFMLGRELSQRTYPNIGVTEPHHSISHHGNRPAAIEAHAAVNTYHVTLFAKFIERLKDTPDGDGSLLDHSLILYGSGMGNGNLHSADMLPTLLVGAGAGAVKGDRHIVARELTPNADLLISVAEKFDVELERFGGNKGRVSL